MTEEDHDHDRGLAFDLPALMGRRRALSLFAGAGLATLVGCGSAATRTTSSATTPASTGATTSSTSLATTSSTAAATATTCATIPEETAGPYPGDGSNGPDVLTESGIVRSDIRTSFGSASGAAEGVPLTIRLAVTDTATGCTPRAGAAVYVWHCDREGRYSMYSPGVTDQNYLRGVQETDAQGVATFTSIFPAAYSGRWPHIHFEVYPDLAAATGSGTKLATSQIALPEDACHLVYATDGYEASVANLARTSLATDMVFRDGWDSRTGHRERNGGRRLRGHAGRPRVATGHHPKWGMPRRAIAGRLAATEESAMSPTATTDPPKLEHPTPAERAARGKQARAKVPRSSHAEWAPGRPEARSARPAGRTGRHPRARPGAHPPRPHGRLAVRLLPGRGLRDGLGSVRRAPLGSERAAVR